MTLTPQRRGISLPVLEVAAFVMIIAAVLLFLAQLSNFSSAEERLPFGLEIAGVPVGGRTQQEAAALVEQVYGQQVILRYPINCSAGQETPCAAESASLDYPLECSDGEGLRCEALIPLEPSNIGLRVNSETMLSSAEGESDVSSFWPRFWDYLWRKQSQQTSVDLSIEYSQEQLRVQLEGIAARFDRPPQPAQPVLSELSFRPGTPGYTLDVQQSMLSVDEALRLPVERQALMVIETGAAPQPNLETLQELLVVYLTQPELHEVMSRALVRSEFDIIASVYVIDLQTGEEMNLNINFGSIEPRFYDYDIAYSAASAIKIAIMAELMRYISWTPSSLEIEMVTQTMTRSSNFNANLMLAEVGDGSPTRGLETVTQSMDYLGLSNTFVVVEFDLEKDGPYVTTEARECARLGECVDTRADYNRQTTSRDMASLLNMIYQCATTGGGGFMVAYPGEFTQSECRLMIDVMNDNLEGVLILAGVPGDTPVAHKHGWIDDTFADAGIVQSPGGDYVLVMYMWADAPRLPPVEIAFPIMKTISEATFNYFNPDLINEPRLGTPFDEPLGDAG